jgi:hypothetical protein
MIIQEGGDDVFELFVYELLLCFKDIQGVYNECLMSGLGLSES